LATATGIVASRYDLWEMALALVRVRLDGLRRSRGRDRERLAKPKITLREKTRIRIAADSDGLNPPGPNRTSLLGRD